MKKISLFSAVLIGTFCLVAQPKVVDAKRFAFEPDLTYNSSVPSPKSHLGYELGEEFTLYAKVEDYYKALAASSPRVLYNEYGETYEGRPLINLVISSEENIKNIDQLKANHMKLLGGNATEAQGVINDQPVFSSFSYNIHGNEASSTEAAMQVAYRMASANDDETKEALKNSVIIMYICINPDGRDRFAYWYKSMKRLKRPGYEPTDAEHSEPWPGGRTNHYWFDLNRDWVWQVHPESRGHSGEYQKWMPQVHVDYHEQGSNSNYFTAPGTTPRNKLLPDAYEPWSKVFGDANIAMFDKNQINYFTRDRFDFFYPGYGSSYPSTMGAIGMLTEQGSARGRIIATDDKYRLTLRQGIFDHYSTSIATIKASAKNRKELLQYSYDAWQPSKSKSRTKAYFFGGDEMFSGEMVNVLLRNGVKVYQAKNNFQLASAKNYRTGTTSKKSLTAGTYIVPTNQPRNLFINSIMERNMSIEDSVMYDMATWSGPIAYNLETYSTTGSFSVDRDEITSIIKGEGLVTDSNPQYAFVIDWSQTNAPKALAHLWEKKYKIRSAYEPFGDGSRTFPAGSLIILKGRNREKAASIDADMKGIAEDNGVEIVGYNTGRMVTGMDLANTRNRPLDEPKVALLIDPPFSSYTAGQIYFLFDWVTELQIERVRATSLKQTSIPSFGRGGGIDLKDYDVLILPGGGNGLKQLFDKKALEQVKAWVNEGGTLVTTESASGYFTKGKSKFTKVEMKKSPRDSTSDAAKYLAYDQRTDFFGKKRVPGSAMNGTIDTTHPLAFGLKKDLYTLKFGTDALVPSTDMQTVGYYAKDPKKLMVAGYASKENLEHISGNAFAGVVQMGQGKVVFLVDNTQYRMFWLGPSRMMQNAVMQLPGF